jgi:hypothetical protein
MDRAPAAVRARSKLSSSSKAPAPSRLHQAHVWTGRRSMKEPSAMGKPSSFPPTTSQAARRLHASHRPCGAAGASSPRQNPVSHRSSSHRETRQLASPPSRRGARKPDNGSSVGHRVHRTAGRVQRSNDQVAKAHPRRVAAGLPHVQRSGRRRPAVSPCLAPGYGRKRRARSRPSTPRTPATKHVSVPSGHGQVPGTRAWPRWPTRGSRGRGR